MIKVTIEQTISEEYEVNESLITKETPTNIVEESHSSYAVGTTRKVQFIREYAPAVSKKTRNRTVVLLTQEIEDDGAFNLKAVIATINGIQIASTSSGGSDPSIAE